LVSASRRGPRPWSGSSKNGYRRPGSHGTNSLRKGKLASPRAWRGSGVGASVWVIQLDFSFDREPDLDQGRARSAGQHRNVESDPHAALSDVPVPLNPERGPRPLEVLLPLRLGSLDVLGALPIAPVKVFAALLLGALEIVMTLPAFPPVRFRRRRTRPVVNRPCWQPSPRIDHSKGNGMGRSGICYWVFAPGWPSPCGRPLPLLVQRRSVSRPVQLSLALLVAEPED
jgi:hypothetical protein